RPGDEAEPDAAPREDLLLAPVGLAQPPPGPVPPHASPEPAARREGRRPRSRGGKPEEQEGPSLDPVTAPKEPSEFRPIAKTLAPGQGGPSPRERRPRHASRSAAGDLSPAVASAPCVRPSSTSAPGTHASSSAGAGSAGRSASRAAPPHRDVSRTAHPCYRPASGPSSVAALPCAPAAPPPDRREGLPTPGPRALVG